MNNIDVGKKAPQFTLNGTGYTGIAVALGADTRGIIVGMLHRF